MKTNIQKYIIFLSLVSSSIVRSEVKQSDFVELLGRYTSLLYDLRYQIEGKNYGDAYELTEKAKRYEQLSSFQCLTAELLIKYDLNINKNYDAEKLVTHFCDKVYKCRNFHEDHNKVISDLRDLENAAKDIYIKDRIKKLQISYALEKKLVEQLQMSYEIDKNSLINKFREKNSAQRSKRQLQVGTLAALSGLSFASALTLGLASGIPQSCSPTDVNSDGKTPLCVYPYNYQIGVPILIAGGIGFGISAGIVSHKMGKEAKQLEPGVRRLESFLRDPNSTCQSFLPGTANPASKENRP